MRRGWFSGRVLATKVRVFVIAGEPSGDALGAAVMAGLKTLQPDVTFDGVGGPLMIAEGLTSRFEMSELSVMGIAEVLPKYFPLKRRISEMANAVIDTQPDMLLTIDSPDFCLRVAKLVKACSDVRTVHYVAPSVWAWRPQRAQKMARFIDHVLALLPFEPPYMERAGMVCDFVGHPIAVAPVASSGDVSVFQSVYKLEAAEPLVLVLPGSRKGEVSRMGPVFGEAIERFCKTCPKAQIVTVAAPSVAGMTQEMVRNWPVPTTVIPGEDLSAKRAAFRAADVALAASGTVSLELAAAETPMVIGHKMNPVSFRIIRSMALIDTVTLVNIVTDTRHVPEFLGPDCQPEALSKALEDILAEPNSQKGALRQTMLALGLGGEAPGLRAARAILQRM